MSASTLQATSTGPAPSTASRGTHDAHVAVAQEAELIAPVRAHSAEDERDQAYRERAHLLGWIAVRHPAVIAPAVDVDEPGWQILCLVVGAEKYARIQELTASTARGLRFATRTEYKREFRVRLDGRMRMHSVPRGKRSCAASGATIPWPPTEGRPHDA